MGMNLLMLAVATVIRTAHPTWEVVVADDVMGPPAAEMDAAPEIQRRMDALGKAEGGTLFLKAGVYRIATPLILPPNVTLKGDYLPGDVKASTRFDILFGKGDEGGTPAFQLNAASGLQGLCFFYPEQTLADPKPYPWTVMNALKPAAVPEHQTIRDCTFVNAWQAISIGPHWNELHTFMNVRICALKRGVLIDATSDTGRTEDVRIAPRFWSASGLPGAPAEADLRAYLKGRDTVGFHVGRSDWENVWRLSVEDYKVGCRFTRGVRRGLSNAVMAECSFLRCGTGLEVDELNEVGVGVYDATFRDCGASVHALTNFHSVVQLLACDFGGKAPVNDGSPLSTFLVRDGEGAPVRHRPMVWPRPDSDRLFVATDYGVAATNRDNAGALQKALDAARAAGGGTVYLPGGQYAFRRGVTVPTGVELRGNCATPHHTVSGGTMLLVCCGKGDEAGTPFVRLEPGAGLRGLSVWYPENPRYDPLPYPWTVRSLGPACWIADVNIANAWQAVDFASFPSDGHRIAYLSGNALRRGLFVGNCRTAGWVENTQLNPHYSSRLPRDLPRVDGEIPAGFGKPRPAYTPGSQWMRRRLEAHVFRDCADERILSTFVYAARDGISFFGKNRASLVIHGTDTGGRCMEIAQEKGSELRAALCQLTPFETHAGLESAGVHFAKEDAGRSMFGVCQFWVAKPSVIGEGKGVADFMMANSLSEGADLRSGRFRFADFRFAHVLGEECFRIGDMAKVELVDSGAYAYPRLPRPSQPPVDLVVDFEKVRPSEHVVGKYGSIRDVSSWCTHVFGKTYRFRAALKGVPHSNAYAEFLKGLAIPVYENTFVSYRIRPLTDAVDSAQRIAFDFHFTDGSLMRTSPYPSWPSRPLRKGEWAEVRVRLTGSVGKTIDYMMLRVDVRNTPAAVYEAAFDSIKIVTPR